MQFHIGPATYTVFRQYDLSLDGEPVQGLIDCDAQTITIDGLIETRTTFVDILRHEHAHAWEWHVGKPGTAEQRAQWTATVGETFDRDFQAAGGGAGFLALPVRGTRPVPAGRKLPAFSAAYLQQRACGACGQSVTAGSIGAGTPQNAGGGQTVERWMRCPVCTVVTVWRESCDADGTPSGGIIRARVVSGLEAAAWMSEHPTPECEWNVA